MIENNMYHSIIMKNYINEKEYNEIRALEQICHSSDGTNLKLEVDYKLAMHKDNHAGLLKSNEFFYYIGETLVAYLGISCFDGTTGEINGMTHPEYRRKGIFKKLCGLALQECQNRSFHKLLLLTDGNSLSGNEFIKSVGGHYDLSEYRMRLLNPSNVGNSDNITLRQSNKIDQKEIRKQNEIFFNDTSEEEETPIEAVMPDEFTYMVELDGVTIGKIRIKHRDDYAFISGFGILPDYRGKGYGRAALKEALRLIYSMNIHVVELDVACNNSSALPLYQSCGFEQKSVMNYYEYRCK